MTGTKPAQARPPRLPPPSGPFAARSDTARAVGVVMSLVPCGTETARHVLARTARATEGDAHRAAEAVLALIRGRDPHDPVQQALRTAIVAARTMPGPGPGPGAQRIRPGLDVLRAHLARFRELRRLALTTPSDPAVQARLDDAAYTLCVLVGNRTPHAALRTARLLLAEQPKGAAVADR
ncbi:DUF5133 domain-containing protein [Streptomyces sp. G-G2]|uniref:DUF5133 domain-containing protein n=1 Tax=Streptomyces sp. G-G2 TaxID=3046201 RepID=UPI0024BA8837|nr:DUF5133 domain-containing protein [Streptomyces sp. G-G2]MDJ0385607.1 DUF5133 domain-containing protein [Streptomyces sp. G-G2]